MPYVRGFLKVGRRQRPGRPDHELPGGETPVDPDYGIDEGSPPGIWPGDPDHELPEPPPGVWPPLTPEHPWLPIAPGGRPPHVGGGPARPPAGGGGRPDQGLPGEQPEVQPPIALPPGSIWPPLPPGVHGKFLALVLIAGTPGYKYRYVVIDADALPRPGHPIEPGGGGGEPPTTPQPKR